MRSAAAANRIALQSTNEQPNSSLGENNKEDLL